MFLANVDWGAMDFLSLLDTIVTTDMNGDLSRDFTVDEVAHVLKQMNPMKR